MVWSKLTTPGVQYWTDTHEGKVYPELSYSQGGRKWQRQLTRQPTHMSRHWVHHIALTRNAAIAKSFVKPRMR